MADTDSTSGDTVAKTATFAMYAVAQHMLDHRLPAPFSIKAPSVCPAETGTRRVTIAVPSSAATEWLDSVLVVDERTRPAVVPTDVMKRAGRWIHVEYDVLIPSPLGDVAATIALVRGSELALVPSGGAA